MRTSAVVLAGCLAGGCTETGAHLTFSAPQGPSSAASFHVVLATSELVPMIQGQRVELGDNRTQAVSYYLQRTIAGADEQSIDELDGFAVRIAPGDVNDTQFIPFVLVSDANGGITGVGTYRAGEGAGPSPILVMRDEIDKYTLSIEPVVQVGEDDIAGPGQIRQIDCFRGDDSIFRSGLIWRPAGGGELRIVLPDDGGTDATDRALDLDCDDHAVTPESSGPDCDDTRDWFHRDAEDVCDGYDTNCDTRRAIATTCTDNNVCSDPSTGAHTGVGLCDDTTGTQTGCFSTATCLCATNQSCVRCEMPYAPGTSVDALKPCQPAIGLMSTYGKCTAQQPCAVEVASVTNGWKVEIAASASGGFGSRAVGVVDSFTVKAKHTTGSSFEVQGPRAQSLAEVSFALLTESSTQLLSMRLGMQEAGAIAMCADTNTLICTP
jgi:hypothetical protein